MAEDMAASFRIDKTAFIVTSLKDPADDRRYWFSRTPEERLAAVEFLRQMNYGSAASTRLQRIFEITERSAR